MGKIHLFSEEGCDISAENLDQIGIRGKRVYELAHIKIPVAPGFILDSRSVRTLEKDKLTALIRPGIAHMERLTGKKLGDATDPLLVKILASSNLRIAGQYPSIHNVGMNETVLAALSNKSGQNFARHEYAFLLSNYGKKLCGLENEVFEPYLKAPEITSEQLVEMTNKIPEGSRLSDDPARQIEDIIWRIREQYRDPEDPEDELSIMVQAMVYGNYTSDSISGEFYSRNIIDGKRELSGKFAKASFDIDENAHDISELPGPLHQRLSDIARRLEENYRELRFVKFTQEGDRLWIIEQRAVDNKSTQATIKTLLDLLNQGIVTRDYVINQLAPSHLTELLHPIIDVASAAQVPHYTGGLAGSPGAATGRVFFSTEKLMTTHREATLRGEDTNVILCLEASYAEDVKGIEVSQGIISVEGGYASHAPVVARSLGKVSLVNGNIRLKSDDKGPYFELGEHTVREGDYITIDVPFYKTPEIYFGKVDLIKPNVELNGLLDFMRIVQERVDPDDFYVRANADLGRDAQLARQFGAQGVGLCRTEHMFFAEERINNFREMILAETEKKRREQLNLLEPMQIKDFYDLFKIMHPHGVTIRLLDAPLHEFLPRTEQMFQAFTEYLDDQNREYDATELKARIERMGEVNPMLGHRGCRVAISYPEIYEMQIRAIFKACVQLQKEGIDVRPEIMIPIVMNEAELRFIRNGKKIEGKEISGIKAIHDQVTGQESARPLDYQVGTMVELPAAALNSDALARYADFFSFGTNDLTQTTFGLSRDDANSFFPVYTEYDLLKDNPFQVLGDPVKELVGYSATRGRIVRPDLKLGLCGEHGADPANIEFCRETGLNYVSCSPYSVPLALLAIAQSNISREESAK